MDGVHDPTVPLLQLRDVSWWQPKVVPFVVLWEAGVRVLDIYYAIIIFHEKDLIQSS